MNYSVENSRHFTPWTDPVSQVKSFILTDRVAPLQQTFYFTNRSMTADGRYLWFCCAFPPAGDAHYGRTLGVLDLDTDEMFHFPETQFMDASPLVDDDTGEIYWTNKYAIWKRSPHPKEEPKLVARFPKELASKGTLHRIATHLTFSADKQELCFDAEVGNRTYLGSVSLATGKFEVWQELDCFTDDSAHHAQFNPVDKDLILFCKSDWIQKETGEIHGARLNEDGKWNRLWTIRRGDKAKPIKPKWVGATHEWWSPDGNYIYYIDTGTAPPHIVNQGTIRVDLQTGEQVVVNPYSCTHGHAAKNGFYFIADHWPTDTWYRGQAANTFFYNGLTGKKIDIVTWAPALYTPEDPCVYHIDMHPQFVKNDGYIAYTTYVLGKVDVAITKTDDLIVMTQV